METLDKQQHHRGLLKLFSKKCCKSFKLCYSSCNKDSHKQVKFDQRRQEEQQIELNEKKRSQRSLLKHFSKMCSKQSLQTKSKKLQQQMLQLTHDCEKLKMENLEISHDLEDKTQLYKLLRLHYKSLYSDTTTKELEVERLEQEVEVWSTRAMKAETTLELKQKDISRALAEADKLRLLNKSLTEDLQETRKEVQTVNECYEAEVVEWLSRVQEGEILKDEFMEKLRVANSLNDEKEMALTNLGLELENLNYQNVELRSLGYQVVLEKQKLENQVEQLKARLVSLTEMKKSSEVQQRESLIAELMEHLKMARSVFDEKNLALETLKLEVEGLRHENVELLELMYQHELKTKKLNSQMLQQPQNANSLETSTINNMLRPPGFEAIPMMQFRKSSFLISGTPFEVDAKYMPIKLLGSGTYGVVCSFMDNETGEKVAIKKIKDAFICQVAGLRSLREIRILRHLNHPNVITLKDVLLPADRSSFEETYHVYELMDADLDKVIYSSMDLSDDHCRHLMLGVLKGLKYLHNGNILHRDLKPANLFIGKNWNIKIGDFGLARTTASGTQCEDVDWYLTEYVASRWYRAPEILLGCPYGKSSDMWSVGCIFAEILGRQPFMPGTDNYDQLDWIFSLVGRQKEDELKFVASEQCKHYVLDRSKDIVSGVDLFKLFPKAEGQAIDLLRRMLVFNPAERISVAEALHHPYFSDIYDPMVVLPKLEPIDLEVEGVVDVSMLRDLVWKEMMHFKPCYSYFNTESPEIIQFI